MLVPSSSRVSNKWSAPSGCARGASGESAWAENGRAGRRRGEVRRGAQKNEKNKHKHFATYSCSLVYFSFVMSTMSRIQSIVVKPKAKKNMMVSKKSTMRRNVAPPPDNHDRMQEEEDDDSEWIDESDNEDAPSEADEYTTDDGFVVKDGDGEDEEGNANEIIDQLEYKKFVQSLFPSKYWKQRVEHAIKERELETAAPIEARPKSSKKKNGMRAAEAGAEGMVENSEVEQEKKAAKTKYNLRPKKRRVVEEEEESDAGAGDVGASGSGSGGDDATANAEETSSGSGGGSDESKEEDEEEEEKEKQQASRFAKTGAGKKKGLKTSPNENIIIVLNSAKRSKRSGEENASHSKRHEKDEYDSDEDSDYYDYDEYDEDSDEETEDEDAPIEDSDPDSESEEEEEMCKKADGGKYGKNNAKAKASAAAGKEGQNAATEDAEGTEAVDAAVAVTPGEEGKKAMKGQLVRTELVKEREYLQAKVNEARQHLQAKSMREKIAKQCIAMNEKLLKKVDAKIEKYDRKEKERNERIFDRIIQDKHSLNDHSFYRKLDAERQKWVIKQMREVNSHTRVVKPYRMTILELEVPMLYKAIAMKKVALMQDMMNDMGAGGEYFKVKQWLDAFMQIPFGKYLSLPVTMQTPPTPENEKECQDFISNAAKTLDEVVYGMEDAKIQIMQMLSLLITNPNAVGNAIAIHGPMGCGKTTLIREGVSRILNRPFELIALGGATDSSFLEGTGYVYEGSVCGKIVQILMHSKCMNPVIYFDELDKISDTPKGEEITNILTHLTDTSQNSEFHDKYFSELSFDLSKCLFIFSYNDGSKVNSILKDRMYHIHTKGYGVKEKTIIAEKYLIPKMFKQVKMDDSMIQITPQALTYLINNRCNNEEGVRNLKRCIETIYYKINMCRLLDPESAMYKRIMESNVPLVFPCTVDDKMASVLVKDRDESNLKWRDMFV